MSIASPSSHKLELLLESSAGQFIRTLRTASSSALTTMFSFTLDLHRQQYDNKLDTPACVWQTPCYKLIQNLQMIEFPNAFFPKGLYRVDTWDQVQFWKGSIWFAGRSLFFESSDHDSFTPTTIKQRWWHPHKWMTGVWRTSSGSSGYKRGQWMAFADKDRSDSRLPLHLAARPSRSAFGRGDASGTG